MNIFLILFLHENICCAGGEFRGGLWGWGSVEPPFDSVLLSWEILDKFGTLFLICLFNKSILLPVNVCKIAG